MNEPSNTPMSGGMPSTPATDNNRIMAIASLVIGILNLCVWLVPICGVGLGITGAILGYFGRRSPTSKNLATAGMVLSIIGVLLAIGSFVFSLIMGPSINDIFNTINQSLAP